VSRKEKEHNVHSAIYVFHMFGNEFGFLDFWNFGSISNNAETFEVFSWEGRFLYGHLEFYGRMGFYGKDRIY
jgi:hypothetical protein